MVTQENNDFSRLTRLLIARDRYQLYHLGYGVTDEEKIQEDKIMDACGIPRNISQCDIYTVKYALDKYALDHSQAAIVDPTEYIWLLPDVTDLYKNANDEVYIHVAHTDDGIKIINVFANKRRALIECGKENEHRIKNLSSDPYRKKHSVYVEKVIK